MKKILGLDLGTTSIGWAFVNEAENADEVSSIIRAGVRVVPLSSDEENEFEKGRPVSTNVARRMHRGARRNLDRYQLRRDQLFSILKRINFIDEETVLTEDGKDKTHETYFLRSRAVDEKLGKEELARVLLMINKKRGYKSNRKGQEDEDGNLVDGIELAKILSTKNLTPGQYLADLEEKQVKIQPDFYRSDLVKEFARIWSTQKEYYREVLTITHREALEGLNKNDTARYFKNTMNVERSDPKGSRIEKKMLSFQWRADGVEERIEMPQIAYILTELNNEINQSSGYLNEISDRSKKLIFNDMTVGQYLYQQLWENPHTSLKNQVFYRQDYEDEFNAIWEEQSKHHPELTSQLKKEIAEQTIFYQRRLKSQKGLISICELEGKELEIVVDGKKKKRLIGPRVAPKSSPMFQAFKIWQNINSLRVTRKDDPSESHEIEIDTKEDLYEELNKTDKWTESHFLKWLFDDSPEDYRNWSLNFQHIEGNRTQEKLYEAYNKLLVQEGHEEKLINKISTDELKEYFSSMGIDSRILDFDPGLEGDQMAEQPHYKLWHLLYSYEADQSKTGNESLIKALKSNFGFSNDQARILSKVTFHEDYGNLSVRAMKKIMPHLQEGQTYDKAAFHAGYDHSHSVNKQENKNRELLVRLDILKKNSLRNPVVEKILNQMINVVNAILDDPEMGRPDEIRIELARDLKQSAEQRSRKTTAIAKATKRHDKLRERLKKEFGLQYVSRNDLIKYKLYLELEPLGFHTPYSNTYIPPGELFTNRFDIEHIIPQSRMFDDSFSNKTLELRDVNIEKGNMTAIDYCDQKGGLDDFQFRVNELFDSANGINYSKKKKLLMAGDAIPDGFLNRDLGNSAFIAKKSMEILLPITRRVSSTSGTITARLREDWELIDVLKELNWGKYEKLGLTFYKENRHGHNLRRIEDWSKRNDHRHHAMDAITVAFTHPAMVQYLNNLNARSNRWSNIYAIERKYLYKDRYDRRRFRKPFPHIRESAKEHLESIIVSFKAKNKVTTINRNKIKVAGGYKIQKTHTPRGQLHKETVYGQSKTYVTKLERIGSKFDKDMIATVANQSYRKALRKRLEENGGNSKKAFTGKNSLSKEPLFTENGQEEVPVKVKTVNLEDQYTIRKDVSYDNFKNSKHINKVVDLGVRNKLFERVAAFDDDYKAAFSDLDENPIWMNRKAGISIKRVTITGVSNAESIHPKKDHYGEVILDDHGNPIPVDYVSTGNNHHVAIYRDENGDLQEEVVSFFEAVIRKNNGLSVIDRNHKDGWEFLFSMKQNEMFIFPDEDSGFDPADIDLMDPDTRSEISPHLFRVQKISTKNYMFTNYLETQATTGDILKNKKKLSGHTYHFIQTPIHLEGIQKVRIDHLGHIVYVGEY